MIEKNPGNILKDSSGFTLIEFSMAILFGSLMFFLFYNTYLFQEKGLNKEARKVDAVQSARNTVDILARNFKELGSGVPESVSEEITAASYQSITYLTNFWGISTRLTSQAGSGDTVLTVGDSTGFISGQVIYICSDSGASSAITLASNPPNSTQITLPASLTSDYPTGCLVNVFDTVTYAFDSVSKEIRRTLLPANALNTGVAEALVENIDYFQLKFFDAGGSEISSIGSILSASERDSIRKIEMKTVAIPAKQENTTSTVTYEDGTSKTDGYYRVYLESDINLRNMN